jgi:hypothetical protein
MWNRFQRSNIGEFVIFIGKGTAILAVAPPAAYFLMAGCEKIWKVSAAKTDEIFKHP